MSVPYLAMDVPMRATELKLMLSPGEASHALICVATE